MKRALTVIGVWALCTAAWVAVVVGFDLSPLVSFLGGLPVGALSVAGGQILADELWGYW